METQRLRIAGRETSRATRRMLLAITAALVLGSPAFPAEPLKLPPTEKFHLFLLIGQSNMAGRGKVEEQDKTPHPRVWMFNKAGEWVPAVDPLHFDKPVAGTGLGKTFGIQVAEANREIAVGLIPCAVGGSPIDAWRPGAFYEPTMSHPWDDAIGRAKLAMKYGVLKGILWHQGESDSTDALVAGYEKKLHDLIARLRRELGAPEVPFLVGQLGRFPDQPWDAARTLVDKAHQDLPAKIPHTAFVSSSGLYHQGDKVHFDAASYRELGRRYAEAYLKLAEQLRCPVTWCCRILRRARCSGVSAREQRFSINSGLGEWRRRGARAAGW